MNKRLINLVIMIVGVILIVSTLKAIFGLWGAGEKVEVGEQRVSKLEAENKQLQNELEKAKDPQALEKMARDKLSLVRPGEVVVILPKSPVASDDGKLRDLRPNWKKWWDLAF